MVSGLLTSRLHPQDGKSVPQERSRWTGLVRGGFLEKARLELGPTSIWEAGQEQKAVFGGLDMQRLLEPSGQHWGGRRDARGAWHGKGEN